MKNSYYESFVDPRFYRAWEYQKEKGVKFSSIVELKKYLKMFNDLEEWERTEWFMFVHEFNQTFENAFWNTGTENPYLLYPDIDDSIEYVVEYLKNKIVVPDYIKSIWNAIMIAYTNYAEINEKFINFLEDNNVIGEFVNPGDGETWYYYKGE